LVKVGYNADQLLTPQTIAIILVQNFIFSVTEMLSEINDAHSQMFYRDQKLLAFNSQLQKTSKRGTILKATNEGPFA